MLSEKRFSYILIIFSSVTILIAQSFQAASYQLFNAEASTLSPSSDCYTSSCLFTVGYTNSYSYGIVPKICLSTLQINKGITEVSMKAQSFSVNDPVGFHLQPSNIDNVFFKIELSVVSQSFLFSLKISYLSLDNAVMNEFIYVGGEYKKSVSLYEPSGGVSNVGVTITQSIQNPNDCVLLPFLIGWTTALDPQNVIKLSIYNQGSITGNGFQIRIQTQKYNNVTGVSYNLIVIDKIVAQTNANTYLMNNNKYIGSNQSNIVQSPITQTSIFIGLTKMIFPQPDSYGGSQCGFRFVFTDNGTLGSLYYMQEIFLSYIGLSATSPSPTPTPTPTPTPIPATISYSLSQQSIIKSTNSNSISISFKITANDTFDGSAIDWASVFVSGVPTNSQISCSYQNQILTVSTQYNQNIHNSIYTATLNLPSPSDPAKLSYQLLPNNNLAANFYPESIYQQVQSLTKLTYALIAFSFFVFLCGLYTSKVVVSQMIGVLQLSFFGLLILQNNDPLITPLYFLKYTNGFNNVFTSYQGNLPNKIYYAGMGSFFVSNLNIMFCIAMICPIVALIFFIISRQHTKISRKMNDYYKIALGEWTQVSLLFCLYNFSSSLVLFITYSSASNSQTEFILSIVEIILYLVIFIINLFIYTVTDFNYMGQFKYFFKWNSIDHKIYHLFIFSRIFFGILLSLVDNCYGACIPVLIGLILICIVISIRNSYSNTIHTIRSVVNLVISMMIISCYFILKIEGPTSGQNFYSKIPFLVISLLFVTVAMALVFVIHQIILKYGKKYEEAQLEEQDSQLKKKEQQLQNQLMNQLLVEQKKRMQQCKSNSFVKKFYLRKANNQIKKKKRRVQVEPEINQEQNQQQLEENNQDNLPNQLEAAQSPQNRTQNGLTVERVHQVDDLLRDGSI